MIDSLTQWEETAMTENQKSEKPEETAAKETGLPNPGIAAAARSDFLPSNAVFFNKDPDSDGYTMTVGGEKPRKIDREFAARLGIDKAVERQREMQRKPRTVVCRACKNNVTTRQFCPECGTRLFCPSCNNAVGDTKFCTECGEKLQ